MTNEQNQVLIELEEKLVKERLSNKDISWVETEEEMNDLKSAIIKEFNIREDTVGSIWVSDYQNKTDFIITKDGVTIESKHDNSSYKKTESAHKISGIMILGWLVLLFVLMGLVTLIGGNPSYAVYGCIICGIINLFVFRFTEL